MLRAASAGHIYLSTGRGETPPARRPAAPNRKTSPRRSGAHDMSEVLLNRLSEISQQLGATTAGIEALREDLKDNAETNKAFSADISARVENMTMRMAKVETSVADIKAKVDEIIMPVVDEINERKLRISGAVRVWGTVAVVGGGLSAAFWAKILEFLIWISGHGSSPS